MLSELNIKSEVSNGLDQLIQNNTEFREFYYKAFDFGDLYLVGGAIRDYATNLTPRDLDIIINCEPQILSDLLKDYNYKLNRFDGFKIEVNNIEIDIWSIHSHWAFKENLFECTFENISKGAFFNFDAITINLENFELDADTFIKSYKNRTLDLNLNEQHVHLNPNPEKNIARAFRLKQTMNFQFSERLRAYCEYWMDELSLTENNAMTSLHI